MNWYHRDRVRASVELALDEVNYYMYDRDLSDWDKTSLQQAHMRLLEAQMWLERIKEADDEDVHKPIITDGEGTVIRKGSG